MEKQNKKKTKQKCIANILMFFIEVVFERSPFSYPKPAYNLKIKCLE